MKPSINSNYLGMGSNPLYNIKSGLSSKIGGTTNTQNKSYMQKLKKK